MVDFLRDFIHILRSSDLRVSTSESIDAMNVVSEIGLEDRSLLKHSLSFSLAKTLREKEIFSECFDNFFEENYMNLSEDKLPQKNNEKDSDKPSTRITEADLRGALSNDRLSDEEKELLAKEQEIQIKKSQRRKTDYQLSFALDVISGLNIYGIND